MPELPEIYILARQLQHELKDRRIEQVEVLQDKCLNVARPEFVSAVLGRVVEHVRSKGKWLFIKLGTGPEDAGYRRRDTWLMISLGMGGDLFFHKAGENPAGKVQFRFFFSGGVSVSIRFWWFGYVHVTPGDGLGTHAMTAELGLSPLDEEEFTFERFNALLKGRKGSIKAFLMDQRNISGIGNVYIQDILFRAGLHPGRKIDRIDEAGRRRLFEVIRENLASAVALGGFPYEREKDIYGRTGESGGFLVGYREGLPCPVCGTAIIKIKTGATASFICPACQK